MEALQYWIFTLNLCGKDIVLLLSLMFLHLLVLYGTPFINWPEMLVYPWFVYRQGMKIYTDINISYPPGSVLAMGSLLNIFG